ncbi:hypothetical protein [Haloarcula montana]|uniref:hypothetical protein n=1 Tax=Haloarcula montana TaxID=3111776 RepID=UPI002D789E27|nr:hypothetical protein [Haloarcula sp. GH36]
MFIDERRRDHGDRDQPPRVVRVDSQGVHGTPIQERGVLAGTVVLVAAVSEEPRLPPVDRLRTDIYGHVTFR